MATLTKKELTKKVKKLKPKKEPDWPSFEEMARRYHRKHPAEVWNWWARKDKQYALLNRLLRAFEIAMGFEVGDLEPLKVYWPLVPASVVAEDVAVIRSEFVKFKYIIDSSKVEAAKIGYDRIIAQLDHLIALKETL